jgi:general stress protein YciG
MADEKKGGMTVQEAGRKGGERVASERGRGFYEEIGKKGGQTVARERGHGFYEEIGKKGGEAVKAARGSGFYSEIGHKGGQRVKELIARAKKGQADAAKRDALRDLNRGIDDKGGGIVGE